MVGVSPGKCLGSEKCAGFTTADSFFGQAFEADWQFQVRDPEVSGMPLIPPDDHCRQAERRSAAGDPGQHPQASRIEGEMSHAGRHRHGEIPEELRCLRPRSVRVRRHWRFRRRRRSVRSARPAGLLWRACGSARSRCRNRAARHRTLMWLPLPAGRPGEGLVFSSSARRCPLWP